MYVPLSVSTIWNVVAVVINEHLTIHLYAISSTVTAALSVQVAVRALAAPWTRSSAISQTLNLMAFASLLFAIVLGEVILVLLHVDSVVVIVSTTNARADVGTSCNI
ncbi:hypothetical protein KSP39_PZI019536 [Platanthera zijinensis]|uniref:Uncharacterized protein n=1 Tax=Platanthera zijinensis TaxID=2320716 RepID=A0AAP0B150_9ASPA